MSSHLEAEHQHLLHCITAIRRSGRIAPAYTFLGETSTTSEAGITYRYARLITQQHAGDKQKIRSLGRVGSPEHRDWERAIARREAIVELDMQLSMLTALMERQRANASVLQRDFTEPEAGER